MSLSNTTKSCWCLLVLQVMGFLDLVQSIAVTTSPQPQKPKTVEAQAKFFQDFFSVQLSPHMLEFGHVCEDPNNWEQRYEHKDYKNHRDMGKVRWGDKQGGYGEHYWDLNHAGANNNNNDNDDGSYDPRTEDENYDQKKNKDLFEEPSEPKPNYDSDDVYNTDKSVTSQYDELGRRKRAQPKIKSRRQQHNEEVNYPEQKAGNSKPKQYSDEILQADNTQTVEVTDDEDEDDEQYDEEIEEEEEPVTKKPVHKTKKFRKKQKIEELPETEQSLPEPELTKQKTQELPAPYTTPQQYVTRTLPEVNPNQQYVPYESGAGVRQHFQAENLTPAVPRLFLEPSTGHVVDRATGQAYVLQPILTGPY